MCMCVDSAPWAVIVVNRMQHWRHVEPHVMHTQRACDKHHRKQTDTRRTARGRGGGQEGGLRAETEGQRESDQRRKQTDGGMNADRMCCGNVVFSVPEGLKRKVNTHG